MPGDLPQGTPSPGSFQGFDSFEFGAVDVLDVEPQLFGLVELFQGDVKADGDRTIHLLARFDLVAGGKAWVVLLAEKAVVLEKLLDAGARDGLSFGLLSTRVLGGHNDATHQKLDVGYVLDAKINDRGAILFVDFAGPDLDDLPFQLEVTSYVRVVDQSHRD